jgi:2-polyprenyl-3-methyl-5-hydroxy-6-metoxy-1,4-benzoquinol methylase
VDKFLPHDDELGKLIQTRSGELYERLQKIDADSLGMPPHCLSYFKISHSKRLFFSIETSAHLLYKAITITGKKPEEIVIMDYGAGVGTLFLLASMIECKKVIYCDHLEEWKVSAGLIAKAVNIDIDVFIVGDIDDSLDQLLTMNISCDIITSRNVIEHIYKLDEFFAAVHKKQPEAIIVSSTTANKSNPASLIKHRMWHRKWEKVYRGKRLVMIERQSPGMTSEKMKMLARATRGMAMEELKNTIDQFRKTGKLPDPILHGTNTCDPSNGVWAEHLLNTDDYRHLINENNYKVSFAPGFWDTHYDKKYKNFTGRLFNRIIKKQGKRSMQVAPFIYVIAIPRKN